MTTDPRLTSLMTRITNARAGGQTDDLIRAGLKSEHWDRTGAIVDLAFAKLDKVKT